MYRFNNDIPAKKKKNMIVSAKVINNIPDAFVSSIINLNSID